MLKHWLSSLFSLSGRCVVCRHPLQPYEQDICSSCLSQLPYTNLSGHEENVLEKYFWERIPIVRATSLFTYYQGAKSHQILQYLKYKHQASIGITFGRIMARQLQDTSFFNGIDMIVPVPLASARLKKRGYNQSECLARGLQEITHLPVITEGIVRKVSNVTQTRLSHTDRRKNVEGIFRVDNPERFFDKHLLLVDDVVTTTATLTSLANAFKKGKNTRFSILTLAMSASITDVPYYTVDNREEMENQEDVIFMP